MRRLVFKIFVFFLPVFFYACDSAYDTSMKSDHEVPSYKVLTDSLTVKPGQNVGLKVEVSDNEGLQDLVFSYGDWSIMESLSDDLRQLNYPKTYLFEATITVPDDAKEEWIEDFERNDGSVIKIVQHYHKLNLDATDINMNFRNIPIYIRVQP